MEFFQNQNVKVMEQKNGHFWEFLLKSMGLSTWFLNFRNTKIQYTLMIFLKKQVFRKIRYTLEVLKKNQFFPIFWKKNRYPHFLKIIIIWVSIISWCWYSHSNYEILCFIFEKKKHTHTKWKILILFPHLVANFMFLIDDEKLNFFLFV